MFSNFLGLNLIKDGWQAPGVFSRTTSHVKDRWEPNLITFLASVQKFQVRILPISWNPGLESLGEGGSAIVSQSIVSAARCLAFKRFRRTDNPAERFESLTTEIEILSQPLISRHPNIVDLEGVCWEVDRQTRDIAPVLVFEKAQWDLVQFMETLEGKNLSVDQRLQLYVQIGGGFMALHDSGIVHGDIKPQNILVFKDGTGQTTAKITDFAKLMDVYSFGLVFLWLLFSDDIWESKKGRFQPLLFASLPVSAPETPLESWKSTGKLVHISEECVGRMSQIGNEQAQNLIHFFQKTLAREPLDRTADIQELLSLLVPNLNERSEIHRPEVLNMDEAYLYFQISKKLLDYVHADYELRAQIKNSIETIYQQRTRAIYAPNLAFQMSYCYSIGFGVDADENLSQYWLERCDDADLNYEEASRQDISSIESKSGSWIIIGPSELAKVYRLRHGKDLDNVLRIYEREARNMSKVFGEANCITLTISRTAADIMDELGEFQMSKRLRMKMAQIAEAAYGRGDEQYLSCLKALLTSHLKLGEFQEAQSLSAALHESWNEKGKSESLNHAISLANLACTFGLSGRWRNCIDIMQDASSRLEKGLGAGHPITTTSIALQATAYLSLGNFQEAKALYEDFLTRQRRVLGSNHRDTIKSKARLATVFMYQSRFSDAEELLIGAKQESARVLGIAHRDTLMYTASQSAVMLNQDRGKEAEKQNREVLDLCMTVLGPEHPDTLIVVNNLAASLSKGQKFEEAINLLTQVLEVTEKSLGPKHPETYLSIGELATAVLGLKKWVEAEGPLTQAVEGLSNVLGVHHPSTLVYRNNLAFCVAEQGRTSDAEKISKDVVTNAIAKLGPTHLDTLKYMAQLASIYSQQDRWEECEALEIKILKTRKEQLGIQDPDTILAASSLGATYCTMGMWAEAVRCYEEAIEARRKNSKGSDVGSGGDLAYLGYVYAQMDRMDEAAALGERAERALNMK